MRISDWSADVCSSDLKHPGMVGAGVMADAEDGVRQSEIIQCDRALPDTDGLRQANTRSLMAHVGAVGEIVGAVRPNHQLIQEGRFVGGSTGAIEFSLVRTIQSAQAIADAGEGLIPREGHEAIRASVIAQGMCQASRILQRMVAPLP